jgi:glutamyl-tRNA synthetase
VKATFRYPGTCREANRPKDSKHVVRFKVPTDGSVTYTDLVFGEIVTPNAAQQDFVLLRSDGVPLYNFGAVVDDLTMQITTVARGRDHMVNTPPQIMLYRAFGGSPPRFAHLPMMLAASGEKLSKRHGAVSVAEYQQNGYSPVGLLNYLIRFGWSHGDDEVFSRDDMIQKFDWARCNKSDGKFDPKKLLAINYEHLKDDRLTPVSQYAVAVAPFLDKRGIEKPDRELLLRAITLVRGRARTYVEAAEALDFLLRDEPIYDEAAVKKFLDHHAAATLDEMAQLLERVEGWSKEAIETAVTAWLTGKGLQIKDVAQAARVALSGRTATPGLYEVIDVMGRERSVARLRKGAAKASSTAS